MRARDAASLVPSLGVRDGGGDELGEVGDARFRIRGERLRLFRRS